MHLKDFPPLPSHNNVEFNDLSPFAQESFVNIHGKKECYQEESKLMLTFEKKYSYVIHFNTSGCLLASWSRIQQYKTSFSISSRTVPKRLD